MLRPYQSKLIEDTVEAARRHKRVLVQLPTGGGKSVIFAELIRRAKEKGRDTLFLVHRRELIYQAAAHLERVGVQAGIIMAGEPYHPAQVQLASRDTLSRRLGRMDLGRFGLVVYDECFPARTLVSGNRIEDIRTGDYVHAYSDGLIALKRVTRTYKNPCKSLVRLTTRAGSVVCTPGHPFFADQEWVAAVDLRVGMMLCFIYEHMQDLRETSSSKEAAPGIQKNVQRGMPESSFFFDNGKNESGSCVWPDEETKPHAIGENKSKSGNDVACHGLEAACSGGEWEADPYPANAVVLVAWVGDGGPDSYENAEGKRIPGLLQGGHSEQGAYGGHRGRREQPLFEEGNGPKEGGVLEWVRVDSIEILEPGSDGTFGGVCPDGFVYNLEVEDFNTYIANGFVVHNCHHSPSRTSMEILSRVNGAHVIGFTATPIRKGGQLLGDIFDAMVCGPGIPELQSQGFLCDTEYMSLPPPDLSEVETSGGDYTEKGLQEKAVPKLIGGVVDHYMSYGGKKGIIFSCGQKHSYYLREDFARHGREAVVIDSRTPEEERKELEASYRASSKGILINCGIFTEGYDVPDCDTLVLARPTKSLCLYLQSLGRGLRPGPGKRLLIIDHGANVYRHGFVEDAREWSLEKSKPKDVIQQEQSERIKRYAACPDCGAMITGKVCGTCGHEVTNLEIARNVRELKNCGLRLVEKKIKCRKAPTATLAQWNAITSYCALKGWRIGTAAHRFKARFGILPWEARLGVSLPRGDEWKMGAREWLEMRM